MIPTFFTVKIFSNRVEAASRIINTFEGTKVIMNNNNHYYYGAKGSIDLIVVW